MDGMEIDTEEPVVPPKSTPMRVRSAFDLANYMKGQEDLLHSVCVADVTTPTYNPLLRNMTTLGSRDTLFGAQCRPVQSHGDYQPRPTDVVPEICDFQPLVYRTPWNGEFFSFLWWHHGVPADVISLFHTNEPNPLVTVKYITQASHPCRGANGLFARTDILERSVVGHYAGVVVVNKFTNTTAYENRYIAELNEQTSMDAEACGNEMRFINDYHGVADRPNVAFDSKQHEHLGTMYVAVIALHAIRPGEELLVDYGKAYWQNVTQTQEKKPNVPSKYNGLPNFGVTWPIDEVTFISYVLYSSDVTLELLQKMSKPVPLYGVTERKVTSGMRPVTGLFATQLLKTDENLGSFSGVILPETSLDLLNRQQRKINLSHGLILLVGKGNAAHFIRDSGPLGKPANVSLTIAHEAHTGEFYLAITPLNMIPEGEELLMDYTHLNRAVPAQVEAFIAHNKAGNRGIYYASEP